MHNLLVRVAIFYFDLKAIASIKNQSDRLLPIAEELQSYRVAKRKAG